MEFVFAPLTLYFKTMEYGLVVLQTELSFS